LTERILVVDDDFDTAEALRDILAHEGYEVRMALHPQEALDITREFKPDVAIIDIGLPIMTGYELVATLKASGLSPCRFIALSGYPKGDVAPAAGSEGFEAYFTKPAEVTALLSIIAVGRVVTSSPA
jgi:CheY-like chemotaxis protein